MWIVLFASCALLSVTCGQLSKNREELLNWCLDSKHHKKKPSEEGKLFEQCTPWKKKACCTEGTTKSSQKDLYNFDYHHCEHVTGKKMSEECQRHFRQDLCFYECEPHIGPWVVKDTKKFRKERFYKVPLCASDCENWWNACKNDYTCTDNWTRNFKFNKSGNYCPQNFKCMTFEDMYNKSSKYFCEKVWDDSWKYVSDDEPCMKIWFNDSEENHNQRVAEIYIDRMFNNDSNMISSTVLALVISGIIVIFLQAY